MRITNQFTMMIAGVLLSLSLYSCKRSHVVTLLVDTDNITQQNINSTTTFGQGTFGQPTPLSNANFTTYAAKGERIIWGAISTTSPSNDVVHIDKIIYKQGKQVLNRSVLSGKRIVIGKVKGKKDDVGSYSIEFTVFNDSIKRGTYTLDPKIQVTKQ